MSCPSIISLPTSQSPVPPWNGNCRVGQGGIPISLTRKMRARVFSPFPTRDKQGCQGSSIITSPQVHKPLASKLPFPELKFTLLFLHPPSGSHGPPPVDVQVGQASRRASKGERKLLYIRPMARAKRCLALLFRHLPGSQGLGTGMHAQP